MEQPEWTVVYNIVSKEASTWIGTGWEFFTNEISARAAYKRHIADGNTPTVRPFHAATDWPHLGAVHRYWHNKEKEE